ncbi:OsmC family protein [Ilumatobacter nonamiensis]|uniref:OsmC family protein n=1 Tax=Ilumatobacter nonamiensis TaxID=467093 RepID=UPI00034DB2A3|nr:OsmC family protein [Ilumatobacter nonamiensis]
MDTIATAIERLESAIEQRRGFGVGTARSTTTLGEGLHCSTVEGAWCTHADLPGAIGGGGSAPTPGVLLRAALGSCMAMSYRLRAAKHGIPVTRIDVTVETDSEVAGMLSLDAAAPPGYTGVRYHVEIDSPASPTDVQQIIDEGDRLSPILDALGRENAVHRTSTVLAGGA